MNGISLLIIRDIKLSFRNGSEAIMSIIFFILAGMLFQFGLDPNSRVLTQIGGGIIWVIALLAAMLSLGRMFNNDYEDGSLEQYFLAPIPIVFIALAKAISHWLTTGIFLVAAAPLIALFYNLPNTILMPLVISMLLGTPTLSLIGSTGAALILGSRNSSVLIPLIVLPLYIPVLIFGSLAINSAVEGAEYNNFLMVLAGLFLIALALSPWATAAALRQAVE